MLSIGRSALTLALLLALFGIGASLYGARRNRADWVASGRRAMYGLAAVMTVAFLILESAFIRSDFSSAVVASHSSTTTPLYYRASAMWSSQEGSLLLWMWLLSMWSSLALFLSRKRLRDVAPYATAVLLGFAAFFGSLLVFAVNPFAVSATTPAQGSGLNPLLRHPSMMIHPPMLYSGYTLWAVPFAFAVGALIVRRVDAEWITATRRFGLAAWLLLGTGILIGARWSWSELGWGGYWAWDPVENASLMPWLTGTAFLHSMMIQEKRGMLKIWNVSLVLATGTLAILGTFLVRSGVLDSIHAFGASTLGIPFVALIGVMIAGGVALVVSRRSMLRSTHKLDSLFSREAMFLGNNIVLVGLCFVIFWGTFFPLISEAATGSKAAVGPPWFDRYTVPLALALVLLSGLGPVVAWRRGTFAQARRVLRAPVLAATFVLALLLLSPAVRHKPSALLMFALSTFAAAVVIQEVVRGARVRRQVSGESWPGAVVALVRRNRRRYGGYTVHLGMAVLFAGIAASSTFQHVVDVRLTPGQVAHVGGYDVRYVRSTGTATREKVILGAVLDVSKKGRHVATLRPTRGYYPVSDPSLGPTGQFFGGEATSEVGLQAGPRRDIWTAVEPDVQSMQTMISGIDKRFPLADAATTRLLLGIEAQRYRVAPPPAPFRMIVSPLVEWIWIGGVLLFLGGLIAVWPAPATVRRRAVRVVPALVRRAPSRV